MKVLDSLVEESTIHWSLIGTSLLDVARYVLGLAYVSAGGLTSAERTCSSRGRDGRCQPLAVER